MSRRARISLIVLVVVFVVGTTIASFAAWMLSKNPTVRGVVGVYEQLDKFARMETAEGTDEMREFGCDKARVVDRPAFAELTRQMGAKKKDVEKLKGQPILVMCGVYAEEAAPSCEDIADVYGRATVSFDEPLEVKVLSRIGSNQVVTQCEGFYDGTGRILDRDELYPAGEVDGAVAREALDKGKTTRAMRLTTKAINNNPQDADAWALKAELLERGGDLGDARRAYKKAIEIDPRHIDALEGLGLLEARQERWEACAERFSQALEVDGRRPAALRARATCRELDGDTTGAESDRERACTIDPADERCAGGGNGL